MTDLKRTIKCSNCGSESSVSLNSDLEIRELLFAGRCSKCGSSLQISYSMLGESARGAARADDSPPVVNIDESLFTPEIPSDTLKDLMEE